MSRLGLPHRIILLATVAVLVAVASPVRARIVFATDENGNSDIAVVDKNGKNRKFLTSDPSSDLEPAWSPDGKRVAFASNRGPGRDYDIYVVAAGDPAKVQKLTTSSAQDRAPSWSPDGKQIAFVSDRDGDYEIFTMQADGTLPVQRTHNTVRDTHPSWSPDGTRIAFARGDEIWVMTLRGGEDQLTDNEAIDTEPRWSPDGERIAFVTDREGNDDIFVMNANGSLPAQLTTNAARDRGPAWSADGASIVFSSNRLERTFLFIMPAGQGDAAAAQLTTVGNCTSPDWREGKGSVFIPRTSVISNVVVEPRGTFVDVSLDLSSKDYRPVVAAFRDGKMVKDIGASVSAPPAKHWKLKITNLEQNTEFEIRVFAIDPKAKRTVADHRTQTKTLKRVVLITPVEVRVEDDGDGMALDCGELVFDFQVTGAKVIGDQFIRLPPGPRKFQSICGGGDRWRPNMPPALLADDVKPHPTLHVVGVDEDQDPLDTPLLCSNSFGGCKALGEFSESTTALNVNPKAFTKEGEEFTRTMTIPAGKADGKPTFTWTFTYSVTYR